MAVASYTAVALHGILERFTVPDGHYTFRPMTSGLINDTFLVSRSNNPLYVLQRINHAVFENISGLMGNLELALQQLSAPDYRNIDLIKTLEGKSFYEHKKKDLTYWRLVSYLKNTLTFNTTTSTSVAFEAGRIIGKFHLLLQKTDVEAYVDTIPEFHSLDLRKAQFQTALKTADSAKREVAQKAISFARAILDALLKMGSDDLPKRICHNDTKLNNILFSTATNKAVCLIDLDTLMAGHFMYDFGDAVRTIANTAPEDERDHTKITFEKPLFEAFVNGLAGNGAFLSETEIHSLPTGSVLMPFLHGLRALTDYLENNTYYKVNYENQNLDRAESLFAFTKKAFDHIDYMTTIVVEKLIAK